MTTTIKPAGRIVSAEDRIVRTFAAFIGAGALLFAVLLAPGAVNLSPIIPSWWTAPAAAVVVVPMVALWPASRARDPKWIGRCATTAAVGYLAALVSWILLVDGHIPANRDIWLATFPGLITMATALRWRPAASLAYLVVSAGTSEVLRYVTRDDQQQVVLPVEIVSIIVFCGLFVVTTIAALATGRALDRAILTSAQHSATSAASAARGVERARFHALVHDRVMSTLLALSRLGNTPDLRQQAVTTVTELERLRDSDVTNEDMDVHTAVGLIRASLVQVDGDVPVEVEIAPAATAVPRAAARSIASAAAEALRDSFRHAGPDADRIIVIDACIGRLRVILADNGTGRRPRPASRFDVDAPFDLSARMARADGCSYAQRSTPGRGTQVVLAWSAPTPEGETR
ncbi:hypothetical protein [Rhodococcus gannanensis]|uniref:Signal transduction histidine kinase n=1 Tax=Rhodococcus gannanensis TaxID=1960308 RepID=A0ABW4P7Q0_9NOCA